MDDGHGQPLSAIERLAEDSYSATVLTSSFVPGMCWWHFWGVSNGVTVVSKYGKFVINETPVALL